MSCGTGIHGFPFVPVWRADRGAFNALPPSSLSAPLRLPTAAAAVVTKTGLPRLINRQPVARRIEAFKPPPPGEGENLLDDFSARRLDQRQRGFQIVAPQGRHRRDRLVAGGQPDIDRPAFDSGIVRPLIGEGKAKGIFKERLAGGQVAGLHFEIIGVILGMVWVPCFVLTRDVASIELHKIKTRTFRVAYSAASIASLSDSG